MSFELEARMRQQEHVALQAVIDKLMAENEHQRSQISDLAMGAGMLEGLLQGVLKDHGLVLLGDRHNLRERANERIERAVYPKGEE